MNRDEMKNLDWSKQGGLLPAVVQDERTGQVLMLAYMNAASLDLTLDTGEVHFWSRSRACLWKKGETSGNVLRLRDIAADCDGDTLLVQVAPAGPVCHTGQANCFNDEVEMGSNFLAALEQIISERSLQAAESSYTAQLFAEGLPQMARKVGEEAVEVALASVTESDAAFVGEAADLLFHLMVLLKARDMSLGDVERCLAARHRVRAGQPQPASASG